jgi:hypothetical protein
MMALGVNPQRIAELEQQNEVLHAAYGGMRAQHETALNAVRSAAAASRELAEKLQKAEDRAARAERLIQALTAALVRSERDALVVASELSAADEALASRARQTDVKSRDAVTAAMQVIADALHTPLVIRGAPTAIAELPYGQGVGLADPLLKVAESSDLPAESGRGVGSGSKSLDGVKDLERARTEQPSTESAPEESCAIDVAPSAAPVLSVPEALAASLGGGEVGTLAGDAVEAPEPSMEAVTLSKALARQVVSSAVKSALSRVCSAWQVQHQTAAAGDDAMRTDAGSVTGAEKVVVTTAADELPPLQPQHVPATELDEGARRLIHDTVGQAISRVLRRLGAAQETVPVAPGTSATPLLTGGIELPGAGAEIVDGGAAANAEIAPAMPA